MTRKEEIWDAINNLQIGTYGENIIMQMEAVKNEIGDSTT